MPDAIGPVQITAEGSGTIDLPNGIDHADYKGIILWNTSGYIINFTPNYYQAGTITIPPASSIAVGNFWDGSIDFTVVNPPGSDSTVSGILAGTVYYPKEILPAPPSISPNQVNLNPETTVTLNAIPPANSPSSHVINAASHTYTETQSVEEFTFIGTVTILDSSGYTGISTVSIYDEDGQCWMSVGYLATTGGTSVPLNVAIPYYLTPITVTQAFADGGSHGLVRITIPYIANYSPS